MLFEGVKLLVTNWRLTLVQLLPAMRISLAMIDLQAHLLHGKSFHILRGPILDPDRSGDRLDHHGQLLPQRGFCLRDREAWPSRNPAGVHQARKHHSTVLGSGALVGLLLGFSPVVVVIWGLAWFTLSLGIIVAIMMVSYVTIPASLDPDEDHLPTPSDKPKAPPSRHPLELSCARLPISSVGSAF